MILYCSFALVSYPQLYYTDNSAIQDLNKEKNHWQDRETDSESS